MNITFYMRYVLVLDLGMFFVFCPSLAFISLASLFKDYSRWIFAYPRSQICYMSFRHWRLSIRVYSSYQPSHSIDLSSMENKLKSAMWDWWVPGWGDRHGRLPSQINLNRFQLGNFNYTFINFLINNYLWLRAVTYGYGVTQRTAMHVTYHFCLSRKTQN